MQYEREQKQTKNKQKKQEQINKSNKMKRRKRNFQKHASSIEEQGELCLSCWRSPSDFFLDLSLFFSQVLLSYFWENKKPDAGC